MTKQSVPPCSQMKLTQLLGGASLPPPSSLDGGVNSRPRQPITPQILSSVIDCVLDLVSDDIDDLLDTSDERDLFLGSSSQRRNLTKRNSTSKQWSFFRICWLFNHFWVLLLFLYFLSISLQLDFWNFEWHLHQFLQSRSSIWYLVTSIRLWYCMSLLITWKMKKIRFLLQTADELIFCLPISSGFQLMYNLDNPFVKQI